MKHTLAIKKTLSLEYSCFFTLLFSAFIVKRTSKNTHSLSAKDQLTWYRIERCQ